MSNPSEHISGPRTYSGSAIVSVATALTALLLVPLIPLLGYIAAGAAIACALVARRELKADIAKWGFSLSLIGFLLGVGIIVLALIPDLISSVLMAINFR